MGGQSDLSAATTRHARPRRSAAAVAVLIVCSIGPVLGASWQDKDQERANRQRQETADEASRREGAAMVALADAAMSGHAASDFAIGWRNDFFKAQTGTFVPFTVTVDRSTFSARRALMYVRATRRDAPPAHGRSAQVRYPFDLIFPVDLASAPGDPVRITRGFAVPPGDYDVYVALRERPSDPPAAAPRLRAAVLRQPLTVPDFWSGELATSSVMLADRIDALGETRPGLGDMPARPDGLPGRPEGGVTGTPEGAPRRAEGVPGRDDLLERPYIIGDSEIHLAAGESFRKDRELIVVFLIYNPTVSADRSYDIQVDYHLFRTIGSVAAPATAARTDEQAGGHPDARAGEEYVTRTNPQRFKPSLMGADFDPAAGHPMLAGQGILLSSFQEGEYRLGITVTDLLSRRTLSRDVTFRVVGS
jgi:hypothetical protein